MHNRKDSCPGFWSVFHTWKCGRQCFSMNFREKHAPVLFFNFPCVGDLASGPSKTSATALVGVFISLLRLIVLEEPEVHIQFAYGRVVCVTYVSSGTFSFQHA